MKLKKLATVFIATVFSLLMMEGGVRLLHLAPEVYTLKINTPEAPLKISENPELGYQYKSNFVPNRFSDFPSKGLSAKRETNNFGFRDWDHSVENKPGAKRVFFVGDSVLDGNFSEALFDHKLGIFDFEDLLPLQIGKILKKDNVEIFNFSVNGYCTKNEYEMVKNEIVRYRPKLVILNFVENDFDGCFGMLHSVPRKRNDALEYFFKTSSLFRLFAVTVPVFDFEKQISVSKTLSNSKCVSLRLCEELRQFMKDFKIFNQDLMKKEYNNKSIDSAFNYFFHLDGIAQKDIMENAPENKGVLQVKNSLLKLRSLAEKNNSKIKIMIWPNFSDHGYYDYDPILNIIVDSEYDLVIEKIASDLGLKTFRLSSYLTKNLKIKDPKGSLTIGDGLHLSATGARIVAPLMAQMVKQWSEEK